jgi:hypothetical protein
MRTDLNRFKRINGVINFRDSAMAIKLLCKARWWYFRNEWNVRMCPFNKKVTLFNRVALIKKIINF